MKRNYHKYILVLGILAVWLLGIPFLFTKAVPVICENLSYNTSYNILIEKPQLYLNIIPNATIKAKSIRISSKNTDDKVEIEDLKLKIRILPLLSGRVHINNIEASNIDIKTILNKNAELDKNFISNLSKTKVKCNGTKINNFLLSINQTKPKQTAVYSGKDIFFKTNGKYIKLAFNSDININCKTSHANANLYLPGNNDVSKTVFDMHIKDFDIEPLSNYLNNYLPQDLILAKGLINIDVDKDNIAAKFNDLKILMKDDAKSLIFPDELKINSGFNISRKTLSIKDAEILSKNINTVINGNISEYTSLKPELNLNIRINKSAIEDFISMSPAFKTEDIDMYKLKKYKFYGNILGNLNIKGNMPEPSMTGNIYVDEGILTKPIPNAKGATVKLDFRGKTLGYDVTVPAGGSEKVWVKGDVELYNIKYANMRVWSTKKVDLATAEEKVVPIHEILNFVIGPVPIMDIKGTGNIDITIKGNRKDPHVWGYLNFYNVKTFFLGMPDLILTDAEAVLNFTDENAEFNLKKGLINNKHVNIDGKCNLAGKFDFDVKTEKQALEKLYKSIQTSNIIDELKGMLPPLEIHKGLVDLTLKVYGSIKDIELIKYKENFFIKGNLKLSDGSIGINNINLHETNGSIDFDNTNANLDMKALVGKSPLTFNGLVKDNIVDASISIPKLNLKDIIDKSDKYLQSISNIFVSVSAKYKGRTDIIEYDKINFSANIIDIDKNNKLKLSKGFITLKGGKLEIKNINGTFDDTKSSFNINLSANKIATSPVVNGNINLKDFELHLFNTLCECTIIPQNIREIIKQIRFDKGKINLNSKISNNNINASTDIGGIEFTYKPLELPVKVINGSVFIRKNNLGLNKINLLAENMPVLIDGSVNDIYSKQNFNIYINSKPQQNFIDKYINNNRIYPLKVKGDLVYSLRLKGTADNYNITSQVNMGKDSNIYYLGAFVGDLENAIILNLDADIKKQKTINIREFSYDKLITSQGKRSTRLNMLKANGGINILQEDAEFNDFRIKTSNPTDARIFNILFKKPNIKQGQFTADLKINGKMSNLHPVGTFRIVETDIPFLDTTMKTLSFTFKDKIIDLVSNGEILGNDIKFKGTLRNKLTPPYYIENAELYTKILDLNYITNKLKLAQVEETNSFETLGMFNIKDTIIKKIKLTANEIKLRNLTAENVMAYASFSDKKVFNIDNFSFIIANGKLDGNFRYNMLNSNTALKLNAENINANDLSIALFDLKNQMYGDLTGKLELSCNGEDFNQCMQTLNGSAKFNVNNGRMPKLGSLEYLLKAGNLLKGGITSLSINSVIDILTPLKTGNFSSIYGVMDIKNGKSDNIEISTKGKDLSLFMTGSYNFATSNANMEVLGLLSKKISTMFGPIGNVSINTLFNIIPGVDLSKDSALLDKINKIPGIELNEKFFRKFIAEIDGDINSENYVKSFKWIN